MSAPVKENTTFDRESVTKDLAALVTEIEEDLHQRLEEGKIAVTRARAQFAKEAGHPAAGPEEEGWRAWLSEHLHPSELGPAQAYEELQAQHRKRLAKNQTNQKWGNWLDEQLDQVAVSWVLSLTFLRYLEDHGYLRKSYVGGTDESRALAENGRLAYLREHDEHGEREFLLSIFAELALLPGCRDLFGKGHSPLWLVGPTSDGARRLWDAFREHDPATGVARWSFNEVATFLHTSPMS